MSASTGPGWRRTVALAVGTALLPLGVLATSATSCAEWRGITEVAVLEGDFPGTPHEVERRLASFDEGGWMTIDAAGRFTEPGVKVPGDRGWLGQRQEACVGDRCWRLVGEDSVTASSDGGPSVREGRLTDADREDIIEEEGDEECGDPLPVRAVDIAAVELDGVVQVVVALERGGIWRRNYDGTWTVITIDAINERVERDRPALPMVTELDRDEERADQVEPSTPSAPPLPPSPTCASPTQRTVTPNPRNGPPTTYEACP